MVPFFARSRDTQTTSSRTPMHKWRRRKQAKAIERSSTSVMPSRSLIGPLAQPR
jgi:hypothetical protein